MPCDFSALSAAQFEYLLADLIGRDKGIRFEQFGAGPDGGMDGRHARGPDTTILQAKHYEGSGFSELVRVLRNSRIPIPGTNHLADLEETTILICQRKNFE